MNEMTFPTQSISTLIKASAVAILIAGVIFIAVVLPVEYGIDPTGAGKALGLTVLAKQEPVIEIKEAELAKVEGIQKDQATILVPANSGVEYKYRMDQYAELTYEWTSSGGPVYFDFHGEPKGDTTGYFKSYTIATATEAQGSMTVPFDGVHGWYWKNTSDNDVTIVLKTEGVFELIGLLH